MFWNRTHIIMQEMFAFIAHHNLAVTRSTLNYHS